MTLNALPLVKRDGIAILILFPEMAQGRSHFTAVRTLKNTCTSYTSRSSMIVLVVQLELARVATLLPQSSTSAQFPPIYRLV